LIYGVNSVFRVEEAHFTFAGSFFPGQKKQTNKRKKKNWQGDLDANFEV